MPTRLRQAFSPPSPCAGHEAPAAFAPLALLALLALLVLPALAGCVGQTVPLAPNSPGAGLGGWTLDCNLGSHEHARNPSWQQACEARGSHTPGAKQEIWLGVNPLDPRNVVIGSKDLNPESSEYCVWNGLAVTHDGGRTWKDVVIGGSYNSRDPTSPYYGFACNTDPDLAFGADGTAHYAVELYNLGGPDASGPLGPDPANHRALLTPGWKLLLATSHDGGDKWPDVALEDLGDGVAIENDYHRTIVSPTSGAVFTAINSFSGGPVAVGGAAYNVCHVDASRDDGRSADLPVIVASTDPALKVNCDAIAVSPKGTVVLGGFPGFAISGASQAGPVQAYFARSTDDGRSFSDPAPGFGLSKIPGVFNESQYRTGSNFELAYDLGHGPRRGTLYAIYASRGRDEADIYVRSSPDDGATWGEPVMVNGDPAGAHQFEPNLAVAADGSLHAFFMDKRYDPEHRLIGITHAVSLDGGLTWANERVSNLSYDGDLGRHQERQSFIGDYIGAGSAGNVVWAAFPDASNGATTVIAAARVVRGP